MERFEWFPAFCRDASWVRDAQAPASPRQVAELLRYPVPFCAFLQVCNGCDLDGYRILGVDELLSLGDEDRAAAGLLPFLRNNADFFCFNAEGQVARWFHDRGPGKLLYPDFYACLLHRALALPGSSFEAFQHPGETDQAAKEKSARWEHFLRNKLVEAGATMDDPWWPSWENWRVD